MRFIKPQVYTVCVGNAFGEAAMLLAAGQAGQRAALPSASIMIRQPMQRFTQMQASSCPRHCLLSAHVCCERNALASGGGRPTRRPFWNRTRVFCLRPAGL